MRAEEGKHFCGCGCGTAIELRPEHFNVGVPRFVLGHNARFENAQKPPKVGPLCACGCGERATYGKRFRSGHNSLGTRRSVETRRKLAAQKRGARNPQFGRRSPTWKGGSVAHASGYMQRWTPEHPFNVHGYVMEHRLVMEAHLRAKEPESPWLIEIAGERYLRREAQVHHVDHDRVNNAVANLVVLSASDHARLHRPKGSRRLGS